MRRRRVLAALAGAASLAGCAGSTGSADEPTASDGQPDSTVDPTTAATEDFETVTYEGTAVPLVPIDVAYGWYQQETARFADARPAFAYEQAHVRGAVSSPAPDGRDGSDPVEAWPTDTRIVTYCGCPHHLSSMRAGTLIDDGYEAVYALDEGFGEWIDRSYPMAGSRVENQQNLASRPVERTIRGSVPASAASGYAWARHEPTGQAEAAPIAADGSYEIGLHFYEIDADSTLTVETPAYTVTGSLRELTSGRVTGADGRRA